MAAEPTNALPRMATLRTLVVPDMSAPCAASCGVPMCTPLRNNCRSSLSLTIVAAYALLSRFVWDVPVSSRHFLLLWNIHVTQRQRLSPRHWSTH